MTHGFSTRAIHAGQEFDPTTGAVVPPIYQSSTFVQDGIGGFRGGYEYARSANPTRDSLQTLLADLEGGTAAFSFASGLSAEDALLRSVLAPGSRIVMGNDVYGGTHRLVNRVWVPWGVTLDTVEMSDLDAVRAAGADQIVDRTRASLLDSVGEPVDVLLNLAPLDPDDFAALVDLVRDGGVVVSTTAFMATPGDERRGVDAKTVFAGAPSSAARTRSTSLMSTTTSSTPHGTCSRFTRRCVPP